MLASHYSRFTHLLAYSDSPLSREAWLELPLYSFSLFNCGIDLLLSASQAVKVMLS